MSTFNPYPGKLPIFSPEKIEIQYDIDFTKNYIFNKENGYTSDFFINKYSSNQYPDTNILIDCSRSCELSSEFSFLIELIGQTIKYLENEQVPFLKELNELWNSILNSDKHEWYIKEDIFTFYQNLISFPKNVIYIIPDYHLVVNHISKIEFQILKRISVDKNLVCFWFISNNNELVSESDFEKEFYGSFRIYPDEITNKKIFISNFFKRIKNYISDFSKEKYINEKEYNNYVSNFNSKSILYFDRLEMSIIKERKDSISVNLKKDEVMPKIKIFISYAWGDNSEENKDLDKIVDDIEKSFSDENYDIKRDIKDVKYKDRISDFEILLGKADFIILVISDRYLKSEHCMNEILQIEINGKFEQRILPIVLNCAKIHKAEERIDYIYYWENKVKDLNNKMKDLQSFANTQSFHETITLYTSIRNVFDKITGILKDMNALTPEMHKENDFSALKGLISLGSNHNKQTEILLKEESDLKEINQTGSNNVNVGINNGVINLNK